MATTKVEFRIPLPCSLERYLIGQLYTVAHMSKKEAQMGSPVLILENIDFEHSELGNCRKTKKLFNISKKVPSIIKALVPAKSLLIEETAYNAFPDCVTSYVNSQFKPETFNVKITSKHVEEYETQDNVFNVPEKDYKKITVKVLDVGASAIDKEYDTSLAVTSNGICPMKEDWKDKLKLENIPMIYCYKLVEINIGIWGGGIISKAVITEFSKIFLAFHQQLVCTMDEWINLSLADIRKLEDHLKDELEKQKDKINENIE